jgi:hypothetical protein
MIAVALDYQGVDVFPAKNVLKGIFYRSGAGAGGTGNGNDGVFDGHVFLLEYVFFYPRGLLARRVAISSLGCALGNNMGLPGASRK